jgi:hypothetical protein
LEAHVWPVYAKVGTQMLKAAGGVAAVRIRDFIDGLRLVSICFEDREIDDVLIIFGAEALLGTGGASEETNALVLTVAFVVAFAAVAERCLVRVRLDAISKGRHGVGENVGILR